MTNLSKELDRAIQEENAQALNPDIVRCEDCGTEVEPTQLSHRGPRFYFDPPGSASWHKCETA